MPKLTKILLVVLAAMIVLAAGTYYYVNYVQSDEDDSTTKTAQKVERDQLTIGGLFSYSGFYPKDMQPLSSDIAVNSNVYEALASFDKDRRVLVNSGLASSWVNPDNLTWRFVINPKAQFSDGTDVTAEDVKFTYDYIMQNQYPIGAYLPAAEVKVVDTKTVDFVTAAPNPILINKLTNLFILSKKNVEAGGTDNFIGSGPYKIDTYTQGDTIKFVRNESYWNTAKMPKVKTLIYKKTSDEVQDPDQDKVKSLIAGKIDFANIAGNADDLALLKSHSDLTYRYQSSNGVYQVFMNSIKDTPLKFAKVREAISLAIDPGVTYQSASGSSGSTDNLWTPATQMVDQSVFGYNPTIKKAAVNTTKAKALLTEAGYPTGFSISMLSYDPDPISESIAQQLKEIGITVELNKVGGEEYMGRLSTGDYNMVATTYSVDGGDASEMLETLFHTKNGTLGGSNVGYSNAEFDSLVEKATSSFDSKDRQAYLKEAIQKATSDFAYVPLFITNSVYIYRTNVFWEPRSDDTIRVYEMTGLKEN